jgi:hypothetical protein
MHKYAVCASFEDPPEPIIIKLRLATIKIKAQSLT